MVAETRSWTDAQRERIEASRVMPYLLGVVDGTEEGDADRIRVALALLNKRLPDLRSVEMNIEGGLFIEVTNYADQPAK